MLQFSPLTEVSAYAIGSMIGGTTFLAQLNTVPETSWFSLLIQTGMTAIVAILLLRSLPMLMEHQKEERITFVNALKEQREEHAAVVRDIVDRHERIEREMQQFLRERGYCPIRDGNNITPKEL